MRSGGFFGRRGNRVRRCDECGFTWTMPQSRWRWGLKMPRVPFMPQNVTGGLLTQELVEQVVAGAYEDSGVKFALSHCAQCGSGHFTESREKR